MQFSFRLILLLLFLMVVFFPGLGSIKALDNGYFDSPALCDAGDTKFSHKYFFSFEEGDFKPVLDSNGEETPVSKTLPSGWSLDDSGRFGKVAQWIKIPSPLASKDPTNKAIQLNLRTKGDEVVFRSDKFGILPSSAFQLRGFIQTTGNFAGSAHFQINVLDAQGKEIATWSTEKVDYSRVWKEIASPYFQTPDNASHAEIEIRAVNRSRRAEDQTPQIITDEIYLLNYNMDFEVDDQSGNWIPMNWNPHVAPKEGFPGFAKNRGVLQEKEFKTGTRALEIQMQEGNVALESPLIDVNPNGSYRLESFVKTEGSSKIEARIVVVAYDKQKNPVVTSDIQSALIHGDRYWREEKDKYTQFIEGFNDAGIYHVRLRLMLISNDDIRGRAYFDSLRFVPQPRLKVMPLSKDTAASKTEGGKAQPFYIFSPGEDVAFDVFGENLEPGNYNIRAEVLNWKDELVGNPIKTQPVDLDRQNARHYQFSIPWDKQQMNQDGYREIRVYLERGGQLEAGRIVSYGRLYEGFSQGARKGKVGLGVNPFEANYRDKIRVLKMLKPGGVKIPVWHPDFKLREGNADLDGRLNAFIQAMREEGIEVIGEFQDSPEELLAKLDNAARIRDEGLANLYAGSGDWGSYFDQRLRTLGDRIGAWLIAPETDKSFDVTKTNSAKAMNSALNRIAQAMEWAGRGFPVSDPDKDLMELLKTDLKAAKFLNLRIDPSIDSKALEKFFRAEMKKEFADRNLQRWFSFSSQNEKESKSEDRLTRLARQMVITLKEGGDKLIFNAMEGDAKGLMRSDLMPKPEFFLLRTIVDLLGDSDPLDAIPFEENIINMVFRQGNRIIFVVWTDGEDVEREIYLGEDVEEITVMGERRRVAKANEPFKMLVTRTPKFFINVNKPLLETQLSFKFDNPILQSSEGPQKRNVTLKNYFDVPLDAVVQLDFPTHWNLPGRTLSVTGLKPGESQTWEVTPRISLNDKEGQIPISVGFNFKADKTYQVKSLRRLTIRSEFDLDATFHVQDGDIRGVLTFKNNSSSTVNFTFEIKVRVGQGANLEIFSFTPQALNVEAGKAQTLETIRLPMRCKGSKLMVFAREKSTGANFMNKPIEIEVVGGN